MWIFDIKTFKENTLSITSDSFFYYKNEFSRMVARNYLPRVAPLALGFSLCPRQKKRQKKISWPCDKTL